MNRPAKVSGSPHRLSAHWLRIIWRKRPFVLVLLWLLYGCAEAQPLSDTVPVPTLVTTAVLPTAAPLPAATEPPTQTPQLPPTATPTETPLPVATATPAPLTYQQVLEHESGELPLPYLANFQLVAFYGTPLGPQLGILGLEPREEMMRQLEETAVIYAPYAPDRTTLPAFHIIIAVADTTPPYYRHYINLDLVKEWIALAERQQYAVILDIQPGHVSPVYEFERIRDLLYHPHVHLALDPEFAMVGNQIPARDLGQIYARDINAIQKALNQIGEEIGVNRVLMLHQFSNSMLPDKANIEDYSYVEIVIDGDGVGSPNAKIRNYLGYAEENAFEYGGFKLFPTDGDYPVLSPHEVMTQLVPPPAIIIYQ